LYQIMYGDPDIAAVPEPLRPLVEAALAKDPQSRPAAHQLLDQLTSASSHADSNYDTPTQTMLSRTWQPAAHRNVIPRAKQPARRRPVLLAEQARLRARPHLQAAQPAARAQLFARAGRSAPGKSN
jgi:hypothetical protein